MRLVLIILSVLVCGATVAQDKIEIEKRVKAEEVPSISVKNLTQILGADSKIKWYYQEDGDKKVYEAKFKFKGKRYSVEFFTEGNIYNVEINTDLEKFSDKNALMLNENLVKVFNDYKIRKIQLEYFGEESTLFKLISEEKVDDELNQQYEVEVDVKSDKKRMLYEIILNDRFELISKREIRLKSTDLLDY